MSSDTTITNKVEPSAANVSRTSEYSESSIGDIEVATVSVSWGFSLNATLREAVLDMHSRRRLWRQPKLHWDHQVVVGTGTGAGAGAGAGANSSSKAPAGVHSNVETNRGETWYELFYDLIFVAAALQIGHIVQSEISPEGLFKSGLLFTVMRATWDQLMFYQNRFDTKDLVHYLFYLLQAMCAFVMANHLTLDEAGNTWDMDANMAPFTAAVAVARFTNAAMYSQIITLSTSFQHHITAIILSQIMAGVVYLIPALFQIGERWYFMFWLFAVFLERTFVWLYLELNTTSSATGSSLWAPWHVGHLIHREGTFILLILGEAIIQLVQHNVGISWRNYLRGLMGFAVVFNIGDLYYQQQLNAKAVLHDSPPDQGLSYISISLHLFLSMSILYFAAGIKLVYDPGTEENGQRDEALLLCSSAASSIFFIFLIRIQHKGMTFRGASNYRHFTYMFRGVVVALCAIIPFVTYDPTWCIAGLFVLTTSLLIQNTVSVGSLPASEGQTNDSSRMQSIDFQPSRTMFSTSPVQNNEHYSLLATPLMEPDVEKGKDSQREDLSSMV